jgi:hypothetical protein
MATSTAIGPVREALIEATDDVRAYVEKHGLESSLHEILILAERELPCGSEIESCLRCDPEADDEWLVVHLSINAPRSRVFEIYDRFVEMWLDSASPIAQRRMHFTYDSLTSKKYPERAQA